MVKVLFVCLGNICRSPVAKGVFLDLIQKRGLSKYISCDSAGTASYHIGESPDYRMQQTCINHGLKLVHQARKFTTSDFTKFDYILAMDKSNLEDILTLYGLGSQVQTQVRLMREFDDCKDSLDVPDPYYGGSEGFKEVYSIIHRCSEQLLTFLCKEHALV